MGKECDSSPAISNLCQATCRRIEGFARPAFSKQYDDLRSSYNNFCISLHRSLPSYRYSHNMMQIFSSAFSQSAWEYAAPYTEAIFLHPTLTLPTTLPKDPLLLVALLATTIFAVWYLLQSGNKSPRKRSQIISQTSSGSQTVNTSSRPLGVWIPVEFQRPVASPFPDWDINTTDPLPYRPFKFGPGHITMGIRAMKWDEWIELDNHYLEWQAIKAKRIEERGDKCCKTAPEAYDAAIELLEEL